MSDFIRFIKQVDTEPMSVLFTSGQASILNTRLNEANWRESTLVSSTFPAHNPGQVNGNLEYYDAYKFVGNWSGGFEGGGMQRGYAGMVSYRYEIPEDAYLGEASTITGVSFSLGCDRWLYDGVRIAAYTSDETFPSNDLYYIRTGAGYLSGQLPMRYTSSGTPISEDKLSILTIPLSSAPYRYLYLNISLENYLTTRGPWLEGGASLLGSETNILFNRDISQNETLPVLATPLYKYNNQTLENVFDICYTSGLDIPYEAPINQFQTLEGGLRYWNASQKDITHPSGYGEDVFDSETYSFTHFPVLIAASSYTSDDITLKIYDDKSYRNLVCYGTLELPSLKYSPYGNVYYGYSRFNPVSGEQNLTLTNKYYIETIEGTNNPRFMDGNTKGVGPFTGFRITDITGTNSTLYTCLTRNAPRWFWRYDYNIPKDIITNPDTSTFDIKSFNLSYVTDLILDTFASGYQNFHEGFFSANLYYSSALNDKSIPQISTDFAPSYHHFLYDRDTFTRYTTFSGSIGAMPESFPSMNVGSSICTAQNTYPISESVENPISVLIETQAYCSMIDIKIENAARTVVYSRSHRAGLRNDNNEFVFPNIILPEGNYYWSGRVRGPNTIYNGQRNPSNHTLWRYSSWTTASPFTVVESVTPPEESIPYETFGPGIYYNDYSKAPTVLGVGNFAYHGHVHDTVRDISSLSFNVPIPSYPDWMNLKLIGYIEQNPAMRTGAANYSKFGALTINDYDDPELWYGNKSSIDTTTLENGDMTLSVSKFLSVDLNPTGYASGHRFPVNLSLDGPFNLYFFVSPTFIRPSATSEVLTSETFYGITGEYLVADYIELE